MCRLFSKSQINRLAVAMANGLLLLIPFFGLRRLLLATIGVRLHYSCSVHRRLRLTTFGKIIIGQKSTINRDVFLDARKGITIGENVTIAHECKIYTLGHDIDSPSFEAIGAPVRIGSNAILFAGCKVMPGVEIAENAVILPFSVLTKSVGPNEVWGGNPAIFKKFRRAESIEYDSSYFVWFGN
jgi:acetyltransferase-like isoleucine patch superfamily enzyme